MRRALLSALAAATILAAAGPAAANGRFPFADQFAFSTTDPNLIVLRTTYGILPSHDNGATWGYICEDALGLSPVSIEDPSVGLTANNNLIVGVSLGLNVSTDIGCNWACQGGPLGGQPIADIAVRPDDPQSVVALTRAFTPTESGIGNTVYAQTFETTDNGTTWAPLGTPLPSDLVVQTIDVTKTDPDRLYVSGSRGDGAMSSAWLYVSTDKGTTWKGTQLPPAQFDPTEEANLFIGGVDPTDANRLYLRTSGLVAGGWSRLTVVDVGADGTPAFTTVHTFDVEAGRSQSSEILGFALSPDGSKVYIGSPEEGLWMANTSDMAFVQKNHINIECLATRGNELWACSTPDSAFVVGVSTDDGVTFTSKLPLIGALSGPIACQSSTQTAACGTTENSAQCVEAYNLFCANNACGTGDAEAAPPSKSSSCSCSLPGASRGMLGGGGALAVGAAGAVLAMAVKRRRNKR